MWVPLALHIRVAARLARQAFVPASRWEMLTRCQALHILRLRKEHAALADSALVSSSLTWRATRACSLRFEAPPPRHACRFLCIDGGIFGRVKLRRFFWGLGLERDRSALVLLGPAAKLSRALESCFFFGIGAPRPPGSPMGWPSHRCHL